MKYKVTGLIVCALIVIALFLSCEKNPLAPDATSEDLTLKSTKTRPQDQVAERDLTNCNDQLSSLRVGEYFSGQYADASYVILYKDISFKGDSEIFITEDPNFDGWLWTKGNKIGNDKVSSVKLLNGATCKLYKDSGFKGGSITLTQSCSNLKSIGWNDKASSIKVYNINAWGVVLYEHNHAAEYGSHPGKSETFLCSDNDLRNNYIGNDCASMIKCVNLDGAMDVTLYRDIYFQNEIYWELWW
jgi:hypothetical protein